MNGGKYIFTQVTSLVPRQVFLRLVKKYNGQNIEGISDFLKKNGHPYFVSPSRHVFPDSLAYDSRYHMNGKGVDVFTSRVIQELEAIL